MPADLPFPPDHAHDRRPAAARAHRRGDPTSRNRFDLTTKLVGLLATPMHLVVVDEAQRLNGDCIELLRHLHDHPKTRFALLYVGGDGCWEVLSKEPMLRSRVFRRSSSSAPW
ncbi:AAA family ATPase [Streptomyces sp. NPDC006978]|uniref:ATP-binding protein n=1 Tax=unclassified Streptomyces TaxID=2593676 RepID=UPI002AFFC586|nr:ATP-binding protein [Streptomyces sp. S584]